MQKLLYYFVILISIFIFNACSQKQYELYSYKCIEPIGETKFKIVNSHFDKNSTIEAIKIIKILKEQNKYYHNICKRLKDEQL